jgi:hypothetical protein
VAADDDADCVEHVWVIRGMTLAGDGTHTDYECARCGAVMVETPADLAGGSRS